MNIYFSRENVEDILYEYYSRKKLLIGSVDIKVTIEEDERFNEIIDLQAVVTETKTILGVNSIVTKTISKIEVLSIIENLLKNEGYDVFDLYFQLDKKKSCCNGLIVNANEKKKILKR